MQNNLSLCHLIPSIKEVVDSGGEATFKPEGTSMRPMLTGGIDEVAIVKPIFPLKKYDIPLYVRNSGTVVLHRIISAKNNEYVMRGDNTWSNEKGITDQNIIGTVSRFKRKGKWHSVTEKPYLAYTFVWVNSFYVRKFIKKCFVKLKLLIKK